MNQENDKIHVIHYTLPRHNEITKVASHCQLMQQFVAKPIFYPITFVQSIFVSVLPST